MQSSIIDIISTAEAQAQELKRSAQSESRENIAKASAQAQSRIAAERDKARAFVTSAASKAEQEGSVLYDSLLISNSRSAEKFCLDARKNIPEAVKHILGRVQA